MKSICGVEGVRASGIKEGKFGLALIEAVGTGAGVFTTNLVRAPPIDLMQDHIRKGHLEAIIANSGCANAFTGERGYQDAVRMSEIAGDALGVDPEAVGVASTGVIGRYLDLSLIETQCRKIAPMIDRSEQAEISAARAIMTTDLTEKHALIEKEDFSVGGITKGSGMIAPNMGTMLAFLYTDADITAGNLKAALKNATNRTFNRVVVDGDMSTNDITLCTATGLAGKVKAEEFMMALEECCRNLAIQIAMDGEGSTKLLEVAVKGAPSEEDAAIVARTVISSPLVKTAVYGEDPNWGRVIAAAGRAGVRFDPGKTDLWISNGITTLPLVAAGKIVVDLTAAKKTMHGKRVIFELDLHSGKGNATAWGCDLTENYVKINGRYTT
jgi:glutamate N-acetyltransferase/amino-acid N-acetyltransferase